MDGRDFVSRGSGAGMGGFVYHYNRGGRRGGVRGMRL